MKELTEQLRELQVDMPAEPDMPEIYRRTRTRIVRRRRRATAVLGGVAGALVAVLAVGALATRPSAPRLAIADGSEPAPTTLASPDLPALDDLIPEVPNPAGPVPLGGQAYIVQAGDTLSGIAEAVYGDPLAFGVIGSANGISESNPLRVGMELVIPPYPDKGSDVSTEGHAPPQAGQTYIVQPSDTLSSISETVYGDPNCFGTIALANGINESNPLHVGQEIVIPAEGCATPTPGQ